MTTYSTIREAQVISNTDPDKKGKIQVKIYPEMIDFKDSDLPWVEIYNKGSGISSDVGIHEFPEVGTWVRVLIEDYPFLRKIRITSDDYVEGLYIYSKESGLSAISELGTQTYPQPLFRIYKDGTIDFHNSSTGEHGTLYKNGQYYLVNSSGDIFLNSKDKPIKVYNSSGYYTLTTTGIHELSGNTKSLVTYAELDSDLQNLLTSLNTQLASIATAAATAIAAGGMWSTPLTLGELTLDISNSQSQKIKTT